MPEILLILLLISSIHVAKAQNSDIFTEYGIDDGLPQSSLWSIIQDKHGFLWLGTADGICRFDGYNFIPYRNEDKISAAITGGYYSRFYRDSEDRLWVITKTGLGLYDEIKDKFNTIFSHKEESRLDDFNCIFGEDDNAIWAGMASIGLLKIDKRNFKVEVINNAVYTNSTSFVSWQDGFVNNGIVWIVNSDGHFYAYHTHSGNLEVVAEPVVSAAANLNKSTVVIAVDRELIFIDKVTLLQTRKPLHLPLATTDRVKAIHVVSEDEIILGSAIGLTYVDIRRSEVKKITHSFSKGKKRSYTNVQCLYRDRSGNIWVGTNGDGIKKIAADNKKFRLYTSYNDSSNIVKAIYADSKHLYAGYFGIGLEIFSREKGYIRNVDLYTNGQSLRHIYAISAADSNTLLMNMQGDLGLYAYLLHERRLVSLNPELGKVVPEYKRLENDHPFLFKHGNVVIGGYANCLLSFSGSGRNMKVTLIRQFAGQKLTCGYLDSKGNIWAGSLNGVFCLNTSDAERINLPENVHVKTINEDSEGNMWIGTVKGIYVLDVNKTLQQFYTEGNGLTNRFVYGILRDDDGNMWFSHNKGLSVFKNKTRTFRHYNNEDGLQSNEFNTGAYFKASDGTLFFGGINGTNGFNPREILDNPNAPQVKITGIQLFEHPMKTDTAYWNIRSITLPYDQNSLSFEFAGLEYTNPAQNRYAYMMEGMDKDWIDAGNKRFTRYAGMRPGNYVFKVKASNNDGTWQNTPTTIHITIVPPFWQQLWFRVLAVLFLAACLTGVIMRIQQQRYKRRMRELELQQKIQLERERISRDLHDNVGTQLSLISNNIDWVVRPLKPVTETEKKDKLHFVSQTAKDIIATLRETIWALNKESISLEEFADKLKSFLQKQLAMHPEIKLQFNEDISGTMILGPSEALNLFRICQEAIANALKYSGAKHIIIEISDKHNKYTISIKDDGSGFDTKQVNSSIQNGIENMKYRASDIGSVLEIQTAIQEGTTVRVSKN